MPDRQIRCAVKLSPEQHYPTYAFSDRDVVSAELHAAYAEATGQGRLYTQLSSVLLGTATLIVSLTRLDGAEPPGGWFSDSSLFWFAVAVTFVGTIVLRYVVDLQKSIILNRRKVVVLRTMLGMSYGHVQAVLPANRIEGAVNPFMLRLFPGWLSYVALPYWLVVSTLVALWLSIQDAPSLDQTWLEPWHFLAVSLLLVTLLFRSELFEEHEDFMLVTATQVARALRVRLVPSPEYALYRSKLAVVEYGRLAFDVAEVATMVEVIEDHRFRIHHGVSGRSVLRALAYLVPALRNRFGLIRSGASTITMQLARTLFIVDYHKTARRKVVESLLALWLENKFSKDEILHMYVGSVRFASGVYGISAASAHYFDRAKRAFTAEEALFLVERLSSTGPTHRASRVRSLVHRVRERGGDSQRAIDLSKVEALYDEMGIRREE